MITKETIDNIFNAARIEEVVADFVQLKKSGSNYKGLSPFSNEKSPSFMISPAKQIWKDFSSGKGGNAVTFLMEHEHFTYPEALRFLAKKYQIEVVEDKELTELDTKIIHEKESLYLVSEFAKNYFSDQLLNTDEGQDIGLSYFKQRGFTDDLIKKFTLGYSPKKYNSFSEYALINGYGKEILEKSGLGIANNGGFVDRFRERVIFPIHNISGRITGFGARILNTTLKTAKYLNSPESDIYQKSKLLYGLFQSKQAILKKNECFLVEGYTDVISMAQSGIENVVSSSGTALTIDQIRLIKRLTNNITIMYDGDAAGIKASFRGIDLILEQELNVKILLFPDGEDPDSFAQKHSTEQIQSFIAENATDFIQFKTKILLNEIKNDPVKKADLVRDIIQSIALIPNKIQQEIYVQECASTLNIREEILFNELAQLIKKNTKSDVNNFKKVEFENINSISDDHKDIIDPLLVLEENIIQLMLCYGDVVIKIKPNDVDEPYETTVIEEIIGQLSMDEVEFVSPFYKQMYNQILDGCKKNELRSGSFFNQLMDQEINQITSTLMMEKYTLSENWRKKNIFVQSIEKNIHKHTIELINRYKRDLVVKMIHDLLEKIKLEEMTEEAERNFEIEKIMRLTLLKNKIDNEYLNRNV